MNHLIDIQHATSSIVPVSDSTLIQWIQLVLSADQQQAELTLRLVDVEEMIRLNHTYRKQNKPTNVLAFPADLPPGIPLEQPFLGDVVICPDVLAEEHCATDTPLVAHWAHIVIHGILHLLGHDHQGLHDTHAMQMLEIKALEILGFANPYTTTEDDWSE